MAIKFQLTMLTFSVLLNIIRADHRTYFQYRNKRLKGHYHEIFGPRRIRSHMRNGFSPWIRGPGGIVWWKKNRESKISWQCPFKMVSCTVLGSETQSFSQSCNKNVTWSLIHINWCTNVIEMKSQCHEIL
jgi:hypothetical protein